MAQRNRNGSIFPLLTHRVLGGFALTGSNAGPDASKSQTTAVLHGDRYILNGAKCFIPNGPEAGIFIVFAITAPSEGDRGISAFIAESDPAGFP